MGSRLPAAVDQPDLSLYWAHSNYFWLKTFSGCLYLKANASFAAQLGTWLVAR
jgi:hypothetical protein